MLLNSKQLMLFQEQLFIVSLGNPHLSYSYNIMAVRHNRVLKRVTRMEKRRKKNCVTSFMNKRLTYSINVSASSNLVSRVSWIQTRSSRPRRRAPTRSSCSKSLTTSRSPYSCRRKLVHEHFGKFVDHCFQHWFRSLFTSYPENPQFNNILSI